MEKYFLHRIRKDNGTYTTGVEIHDTLDSAIHAFHGQMKMAYGNPDFPNMTFVSCFVTDNNDEPILEYSETWKIEEITDYFMHYIRHDGETYSKGIDVCPNIGTARRGFHAQMEYGHGNTKFPNMSFVSSMITGCYGATETAEHWNKPEPEPNAE